MDMDAISPIRSRRPTTLPNLLVTPDPFHGTTSTPSPTYTRRHLVSVIQEHGGGTRISEKLRQVILEELTKLGVEFQVPKSSKHRSRKSPRTNANKDVARDGIHRTVEVRLKSCGSTVVIPFIVKVTSDYIKKNVTDEGVLRKSGSSSRAACIMQRFLSPETDEHFSTFDTVHDVANVLKQYLRELEMPLIHHSIQNIFIQCLDLQPENVRTDALLLATCLVVPETAGFLSYVVEFLAEVAQSCKNNLMTQENLAIVMGPNIMPIDPRKCEKGKDLQQTERHALDLHNKVIEILIQNANDVGQISEDVEKRLDALITLRSSEDELEHEGVGRRKKRRSGSLNRMLGFLKKVTSGKSGIETPVVPSTPSADSFSHTPIIKGSSRKNTFEDNLFSSHKKKFVSDGARKKQYKTNSKSEASTPNTLPGLIAFLSPAICLDPSPIDWKQTPNGNRLKNFVTPGLLRRRDKGFGGGVFSAPARPSKPRLRFGNKNKVCKIQELGLQEEGLEKMKQSSASTISIYKLANSPRAATLQRNPSSSRIPKPEKPALPPKRINSSTSLRCRLRNPATSAAVEESCVSDSGDYVTISTTADLNDADVRNDAFIASSISLTDSEYEPSTSCKNESNSDIKANEGNRTTAMDDYISTFNIPRLTLSETLEIDDSPQYEVSNSTGSSSNFRLTPLIQKIDSLTKTAKELTLSTMEDKIQFPIGGHTLLDSFTDLDTTPLNVDQVENKFINAMKETKIIQIKTENQTSGGTKPASHLQRRLSVQDGANKFTMSPSQRKISSARRKSHEIGRITPAVTPTRFMSLRSPMNNPTQGISPGSTSSTLSRRSPNRCTLKRGRPNTARVGLARPSPVRGTTPRSGTNLNNNRPITRKPSRLQCQDRQISFPIESELIPPVTPMRRMSSVQELVKKLEKNKAKITNIQSDLVNTIESVPAINAEVIKSPAAVEETRNIQTRSETQEDTLFVSKLEALKSKPLLTPTDSRASQLADRDTNWVAAHTFKFDRKDFQRLQGQRNTDRDSIHFLKTLHAGKVPATVEYFNKIGDNRLKSPGKSLIPRYTALHKLEVEGSQKSSNSVASTPEFNLKSTSTTPPTDRLSRRLSAVDIRNRHEQLLENIKKEKSIRRSATTAGSVQCKTARNNIINRDPADHRSGNKTVNPVAKTPSFHRCRPNTLDLRISPSSVGCPTRISFRRTPNQNQYIQTPRINEEDESLATSVQNAIDTLLHPGSSPAPTQDNAHSSNNSDTRLRNRVKSKSIIPSSPLKPSNIANLPTAPTRRESVRLRSKNLVNLDGSPQKSASTTPCEYLSLNTLSQRRGNVSINRTASEVGTKATSTTPRTTPKIKKSLTTRAYDMISTPRTPATATTPGNHAHKCPTITPRRRVLPGKPSSENRNQTHHHTTPLKATHIFPPLTRI